MQDNDQPFDSSMTTNNGPPFKMDRKFDFRALLIRIQDQLSDNDRRRFHFLIGDIIPRHQRDDCTLGGTLTLLESLFDRAIISEDYLDFLIRVFHHIQCHDAVKRLKDYQSIRTPIKTTRPVFQAVLLDNIDEDKISTRKNLEKHLSNVESWTTMDSDVKPVFPISFKTQTSSELGTNFQPIDVDDSSVEQKKRFCLSPLTTSLLILFICQFLVCPIYLLIHFVKPTSERIPSKNSVREFYQLQTDQPFLWNNTGQYFNHAENLSLTFADRLIELEAISYFDDLYSLRFIYSNNKTIVHRVHQRVEIRQSSLSSINTMNKFFREVVQCVKDDGNSSRLVGLLIGVENQAKTLFGSCHDQRQIVDSNQNRIFAFATGFMDPYLKSFQLFWYKICSIDKLVHECIDSPDYDISMQTNPLTTFQNPTEKESPPSLHRSDENVSRELKSTTSKTNGFRKRSHGGGIDLKYVDLPDEKINSKNETSSSTSPPMNSSKFHWISNVSRRIRFTRYDVILLILNLLMLISLVVIVSILENSSTPNVNPTEKILTVKFFNVSGGPGGNYLLDDAEAAALTFEDRIKTIKAQQRKDDEGKTTLSYLNLIYSQEKRGHIFGDQNCLETCEKLTPFQLNDDERIDQVIIYGDNRRIDNSFRTNRSTFLIVGIHFRTNSNREVSYGMMTGIENVFVQDEYFLGYIQGKAGGFIDNLRLVFYKYCHKTSSTFTCIN